MIGYIKGKVLSYFEGGVLIENNGVGFNVFCSNSVYNKLINEKQGEVYTYMAVREDGISLYGFISLEEKNMFLKLISVSGVGPKMGITVLSSLQLNELATMIATSDVKGLSKVKGLGKKTAERIILELREKISADAEDPLLKNLEPTLTLDKDGEDAVIALMSLGFTKAESAKAVDKAKKEGASDIESLIALAIKNVK